MGFISSILCCASDSTQPNSQWQTTQRQTVPTKEKSHKTLQTTQSNIHTSLSNSSQKMVYSPKNGNLSKSVNSSNFKLANKNTKNNKGGSDITAGGSENKGGHSAAATGSLGNDDEKDVVVNGKPASGHLNKKRYSSTTSRSNKKRGQTRRTPSPKNDGDVEDEEKEYDDGEEDDEDDDDEEALDSKNKGGNEEEKHGVYVYNGETDTSTGGSSYDHPQHQPPPPQTQQVQPQPEPESQARTVSKNEVTNSDGTELTTTVHEGENCSSADDTDIALQQTRTNDDSGEIDMVPPYEEDEDYVDLSELQLGQAHARGFNTLLPPQKPEFSGKKCLVLDLDETLVHSAFKYLRTADFVLPVDIDDQIHNVYVIKRPGVDEFIKRVCALYEVVIFTASVSRYGDPLLDILDKHKLIHHRLFRESCYNYEGNYIKNLSQLGRPLSEIIILDNSPASYIFHPQHAIPISSWFSDTHDNELLDIIPLLEDLSEQSVPDVGKVLDVTI